MTVNDFIFILDQAQNGKLSGGITCKRLRIKEVSVPGKAKELIVSGDVTITLKVFDLTTVGAPKLDRLMKQTQQTIAEKLKGETKHHGLFLTKFNATLNKFIKNTSEIYSISYRIHYIPRLEQIEMLSQLGNNDFVLVVVDRIGYKTDSYLTGGLSSSAGPSAIEYNRWTQTPNIATHEFFHTLGLPDLQGKSNRKRLMYELGHTGGDQVSNKELSDMNSFLMRDLVRMSEGTFSNQSMNTVDKLRIFLKSPTNGIKYNKNKFK